MSYLTPITYEGLDLALGYEAMRPARADKWLWQLQTGADYNYVENAAQNNNLHKLMAEVTFDMQRRWRGVIAQRVDLSAGLMIQLRAGVVYNPANSNNTVTSNRLVFFISFRCFVAKINLFTYKVSFEAKRLHGGICILRFINTKNF